MRIESSIKLRQDNSKGDVLSTNNWVLIFCNASFSKVAASFSIPISAYTLDNLLNARREIAVGNVAGFTGRIDNVISIFEGVAEDELLNLMGR